MSKIQLNLEQSGLGNACLRMFLGFLTNTKAALPILNDYNLIEKTAILRGELCPFERSNKNGKT